MRRRTSSNAKIKSSGQYRTQSIAEFRGNSIDSPENLAFASQSGDGSGVLEADDDPELAELNALAKSLRRPARSELLAVARALAADHRRAESGVSE
jgi:hypothetical protein